MPSPGVMMAAKAAGQHGRRLACRVALGVLLILQWSSLAIAASSSPKGLPYVPTTILVHDPARNANASPGAGPSTAYIFSPKDDNILMLTLNSTIKASLNAQTLTKAPFLSPSTNTTSFTPALTADGTLTVYAGDCLSPDGPSVWTYSPSSPKWTKHTAQLQGSSGRWWNNGPSFLGSAIAYSSQLSPSVSPGSIYSYGGMCPPGNQTVSTWQSSGSYSNQIVKLSSPPGFSGYTVTPLTSKGPPLAGAGFTFTPLSPSTTNRSGIVTQQVNHLLLGGHTGAAFMNMSMAAVWSLPEEAWSFVSIRAKALASTELAIKNRKESSGEKTARALSVSVGSRSGHSAVMNADGTQVVVLGGWVGDVSQAAEPQLAVLEMGADYGQWQWSVPDVQPPGSGMYGHGAALLPGNVMLVYGGYSISSAKMKSRQAGGTTMFLNLTSMTWADSYTNPASGPAPSEASSGPNNNNRNLGLGLGLGLGIPFLIALILLILWLRRRRRRNATHRDAAVRALAQDHSQFLHNADADYDEMVEAPHSDNNPSLFPWNGRSARDWYTGGHDPYNAAAGRSLGYESLRGARSNGTFYQPPPPALYPASSSDRDARTPPRNAARGLYQPTTLADYESRAIQRGTGGIHPIHEEEDEDLDASADRPRGMEEKDDPFATPTSTSAPPYAFPTQPEATHAVQGARPVQDKEVQDWVSDVDAADVMIAAGALGRRKSSPVRRSLSVKNTRQNLSPSPIGSSIGGEGDEARTVSTLSDRSAAAFSFVGSVRNVVATTLTTVTAASGAAAGASGKDKDQPPPGSSSSNSGESQGGASFNTARSSFAVLQAEGPGLLYHGRPDPYVERNTSPIRDAQEDDSMIPIAPGSPSKTRPRRSRGWLGSFRRVFSGSGASSPESSLVRDESPSRRSLDGAGQSVDFEPRLFGLKDVPNAVLLRRKQGKGDWEATIRGRNQNRIESGERSSGDWDVERAGEGRNVQVMFTVPKGKLRVVNAEVEDDGEERGEILHAGEEDLGDLLELEDEHGNEGKGYMEKHKAVFADWLGGSEGENEKYLGNELLFDSAVEKRAAGPSRPAVSTEDEDPFWSPSDQLPRPSHQHQSPPQDIRPSIEADEHVDQPANAEEDGGSWAKDLRKSLDRALATPSPTRDHDDDDVPSPILTAEAVRMKRPSTRVLQMVEQFETKSREGSPSHSPARS